MRYDDLKYQLDKRNKIKREYKKLKYPKFYSIDQRVVLLGGSLFVLVFAFLLTLFFSFSVKPLIRQKIKSSMNYSHGKKLEVSSFGYGKMRVVFGGVVFEQVRAKGKVRFQYPHFLQREFDFYAPLMETNFHLSLRRGLQLEILLNGIEVQGGRLLPGVEDDSRRLEAVSDFVFHAWVPLSVMPFEWKRQFVDWGKKLSGWVFGGKALSGISLSGNASFLADGVMTKVYFHSVSQDGSANLQGDPNDLRKVASVIEPKYTNDDIAIASKNLLKTPKLLHIRSRAEKKGEDLCKVSSKLRFDTPRHIFWSYWLTQTFGSEFARDVTNAHEVGDSGNTQLEHVRDRINNSFGIEYAERKLSEKETENMIFTDKRVTLNDQTGS